MDNSAQVREFLTTRRARLTPAQAGLPAYGHTRRVAGLRREEVALLAGVSVDYYTRLERGRLGGVSDAVLASLATALQLDEAETTHLYDLARAAVASPRSVRRAPREDVLRPTMQRILDALQDAPGLVHNAYFDQLAANALGRALYSPVFAMPHPNSARFVFLDPAAHDFYPDWEQVTRDQVAALRIVAGQNPHDRRLTDLVGELSTRSEHFAALWATHNVRFHRTGVKRINHPVVGELELTYEAFVLPGSEGIQMAVFTPEPGSASADALAVLASWAATQDAQAGISVGQ